MKKKYQLFSVADFFLSFKNYCFFYRLSPEKRNIVFYSEGGQDWHHFRGIINKLLLVKREVCYVTSDKNDPGLNLQNECFTAVYIKEGFWQVVLFQFLKADCLVLTMIDLHIFQLKRSINPVHYIYIFHAMGSTHMVDYENSYDHYDTILCVGPHQVAEIRTREKQKGLPQKNLVEHGYARVDELMDAAKSNKRKPEKPYTILIAPTWGDYSILPVCGLELTTILLDGGYRVILRPHYQTCRLTPHIVAAILSVHRDHPRFSYIDKMGETGSLFDSDLLVCDWSSMSIEYALGLEKPVLYIDVPKRVRNPRYQELGLEPMEVSIRQEVGAVVNPDELKKVPEIINRILENPDAFRERIAPVRKKVLFNIGQSVEAGTAAIIRSADEMRIKRLDKVRHPVGRGS